MIPFFKIGKKYLDTGFMKSNIVLRRWKLLVVRLAASRASIHSPAASWRLIYKYILKYISSLKTRSSKNPLG